MLNTEKQILIVDDEPGIRELLRECLEDEGYTIKVAKDALEADKVTREHDFNLVLMDIWLPDMDGVSLFKRFLSNGISTPVIMMSGHASITTALEAVKLGAKDFLEKPLSLGKLLPLVEKYTLTEGDMRSRYETSHEIVTINLNGQLKGIKDFIEKQYFFYHVRRFGGNITKIAEYSGVDRAHLYRKFKQLEIQTKGGNL